MKIKKIILLIILIVSLTGCNAEYSLVYEDDVFNESLNIVSLPDEDIDGKSFSSSIDEYYNDNDVLVSYKVQPGDSTENEYLSRYDSYNKSLINDNGFYGMNLNYDFMLEDEYVNSSIIYSLFNTFTIDENYIKAENAKNIFNYYKSLDKITVSFKTDKKVIEANCDEVKDGVYYWYINKDNYENKTIRIKIDKTVNIIETNKRIDKFIEMIYIGLGIFLFGGIIFVCVKFINSNKK